MVKEKWTMQCKTFGRKKQWDCWLPRWVESTQGVDSKWEKGV